MDACCGKHSFTVFVGWATPSLSAGEDEGGKDGG